ncbi:hypothetical protein GGX14DRAFT_671962 [Mycena pura]|uniref:F-box domain-containing protein n=1 Tax=Mycena pura TaxID=153505 RepID=A0AAD6Y1N5_9AGAR|nr:hypothetical protein GGX14DRAFT_671962 [Mycena pura]
MQCVFLVLMCTRYHSPYIRENCGTACSTHCPPSKDFQLPASPCPELLITNSVPSDFQANEIRQLILDTDAELSALGDEITRVQCALDRLELRRAGLRDFVKSHRPVVSVVRRIPRDILGEIFSHYLDASAYPPSRLPTRLLHLVGVCDRWRTISLASPLLWRHVHLGADAWKLSDVSGKMQQISLQLQRSAPVALSIGLAVMAGSRLLNSILDLLLTESRRWQNLFLRMHPSDFKLLATSGAEFPILEKLDMEFRESVAGHAALFFRSLPALVDLTLTAHRTSIPDGLDFIWAQLRTCTLIGCWMDDILRILPLFSAVARVCVTDCFPCADVHPTSVHTVVSDLSLWCYQEVTDTLLDTLTAPCLKRLVIEGDYSFPGIIRFLNQSACALTHLTMGIPAGLYSDRFTDELLTLLRSPHARDIVDLQVDLNSQGYSEQFMDVLPVAMRDVVPKLRVLASEYIAWLDQAKLLEICENRRSILQSLWLSRHISISQDTVQALKLGAVEVVRF